MTLKLEEIETALFDDKHYLGNYEDRVSFTYNPKENYFVVLVGTKRNIVGHIFCQSQCGVMFQTNGNRGQISPISLRIIADVTEALVESRKRLCTKMSKLELASMGFGSWMTPPDVK